MEFGNDTKEICTGRCMWEKSILISNKSSFHSLLVDFEVLSLHLKIKITEFFFGQTNYKTD